jgi:enoyl-[acyl-carrier protein] reductase I
MPTKSSKRGWRRLQSEFGSKLTFECDVSKDEHIKALREWLEKNWGSLDIIVHSIAYAPKEEFKGGVIDTSKSNNHTGCGRYCSFSVQ